MWRLRISMGLIVISFIPVAKMKAQGQPAPPLRSDSIRVNQNRCGAKRDD